MAILGSFNNGLAYIQHINENLFLAIKRVIKMLSKINPETGQMFQLNEKISKIVVGNKR